jgi:hypothetical protein
MQPITQASLDPKLNDIRHLRADQEFCGVIGCFGLSILNRGTERVLRCRGCPETGILTRFRPATRYASSFEAIASKIRVFLVVC